MSSPAMAEPVLGYIFRGVHIGNGNELLVKVMLKVLTWSRKVVIVSQTVAGHVQLPVNCFILAPDAMSP